MKWVVIGLFLVGLMLVLFGHLGYRYDERRGQSGDVAMGNGIIEGFGWLLWAVDIVIVIIWSLYRLMFT